MSIRVLLIAQYADLDKVAAEVQAVINTPGMDVHLLHSNVTLASLIELDWTGYQVVWFAAHGSEQGIQIGQEILGIETLSPLLQESSAEMVFINTCSSERLAEQIYAECNIPVICTVADADDVIAYATGRRFARALVKAQGDYFRAYELSRPGGNRLYRYIPNVYGERSKSRMADQQPQTELREQVAALVRALTGDKFSASPGLIAELGKLRGELSEYVRKNEEWKDDNDRWRHEMESLLARSQQFRPLQITPLSAILVTAGLILFISLLFLAVYWLVNGIG